ncbi:MAG: peptide deformylase [Sedimentisphaerales bacterium]|nr:peptide deformylase [Sedimentisphaerales bacterium]
MADQINIDDCKITHYPKDVLTGKAEPIEQINDDIRRLVEKMTDIMLERKGVGLAAPQAGIGLRLFIISLDSTRENVRVYINPTVKTSGKLIGHDEGCLSVPGIYTKIKRYEKATVTATDIDGNKFTEEAEGLYARALQHEYDHIEGVTIADKMGTAAKIAHRRQLKKLIEKNTNS